jgi:hypothetical protein
MKQTVWMLLLCVAALVARPLAQGSVDGKWTGQLTTARGSTEVTYTFKADGEKLTGSIVTGRGEIPLQEGTIKGNTLTFKMAGRGGQTSWTGTLKGDEITLKREGDNPQETVLKRQK